eukprot:TRINITY_DN359_c0_g1_i1.p1 TRINITY_DN359_c0_g1~~TRINITY_DN359_c0_g1_i1.p1  ORF type:complete len:732 (-),score=217.77 TRINITY_DN359_c0_g1_i1:381-2396(-)
MFELNSEYEDEFWTNFVVTLGPAGLCNLSVTCRYFCGKFFSTPYYWELVCFQSPPTVQPSIKFLVDTSTPEGPENAVVEKVQTVALSQVKTEFQKQQLAKYWLRTVAKAVEARDAKLEELRRSNPLDAPRKMDINAVLRGGFAIETLQPKQKLVQLRDLRQVNVWLKAIEETLLSKEKPLKEMFVNLPCDHGSVTLRRVGRGGTDLILKVVEGKETRSVRYTLDSFLLSLYSVSDEYLSILVFCKNSFINMGARVVPTLAESWKPNEDYILKIATGVDELSRVLSQMKDKLSRGHIISHSSLPEEFRSLQALQQKRKNDEATTNDNISDFVYDNLPPLWEDTKRAAVQLVLTVKEQREREFRERMDKKRKNFDTENATAVDKDAGGTGEENVSFKQTNDKKQGGGGGGAGGGGEQQKKEKKGKTKTVKVVSDDGFISVRTVAEGEELKIEQEEVVEPVIQKESKKKKKKNPDQFLGSNPYSMILTEDPQEPLKPDNKPAASIKPSDKTKGAASKPKTTQPTDKPKKTDKPQPTEKKTSTSTSSDTKPPKKTTDATPKLTDKQKSEKKEKPQKKEKTEKSDKKTDKKPKKSDKKEKSDKKSKSKQQLEEQDDEIPTFEPIPITKTPVVASRKGKKGTQAQLTQFMNHQLFKPVAVAAIAVVVAYIAYSVYLS